MIIVQVKKSYRTLHTVQSHFKNSETKPVHVKYMCTLKSQEGNKSEQAVTLGSELVERRAGHFYLQPITVSNFKAPINKNK